MGLDGACAVSEERVRGPGSGDTEQAGMWHKSGALRCSHCTLHGPCVPPPLAWPVQGALSCPSLPLGLQIPVQMSQGRTWPPRLCPSSVSAAKHRAQPLGLRVTDPPLTDGRLPGWALSVSLCAPWAQRQGRR